MRYFKVALAVLLAVLEGAQLQAASSAAAIRERRAAYVQWIADRFGALEPNMQASDGRRWALSHARLVLNQDVEKANRYLESFSLTKDSDICFIRFLKTFLDFEKSPRLSDKGKTHIIGILASCSRNELSSAAKWPPLHTENHDLKHLTIGMFAQKYRGRDVSGHVREIHKALAWRFERGWIEWNSACYQFHYSNPLIVLSDHAPSDDLRRIRRRA